MHSLKKYFNYISLSLGIRYMERNLEASLQIYCMNTVQLCVIWPKNKLPGISEIERLFLPRMYQYVLFRLSRGQERLGQVR